MWNMVQQALAPAEEDEEEVDVDSEEWQETAKTTIFGDNPEAGYTVKQIVQLGCYVGERDSATIPGYEPEFDSEVHPRLRGPARRDQHGSLCAHGSRVLRTRRAHHCAHCGCRWLPGRVSG